MRFENVWSAAPLNGGRLRAPPASWTNESCCTPRCDGRGDLSVHGRAKRDKAEVIEIVPGDPTEVEAVLTTFKMARDSAGSGG
jgi:hypothetical protein